MNALTADFYEFTMSCGCLTHFSAARQAAFELFFRRIPQGGGYAVAAGGAYAAEQIASLRFTEQDISWLRSLEKFDEDYLRRLRSFVPSCDIDMVPEGTPVFPYEPILTVTGPAWEAQFLETLLLLTVNHQSLIATKAARICRAAKEHPVIEMGARRAHGADAAVLGARAAYLGGASATTCTHAAQKYHIPPAGTMAHSWVQLFDSEYEAFRAFAAQFPEQCTLLIDTYDVLSSGLPNALRTAREILRPAGHPLYAVRLDSGDLLPLSRRVRTELDAAGCAQTKIMVSGSMDEHSIRSLLDAGAPIDLFGVGERLITARDEPVFGGVYKLCAVKDTHWLPRMKFSEDSGKQTIPHRKSVLRLYAPSGEPLADVLTLRGETVTAPYTAKTLRGQPVSIEAFRAEPLLRPLLRGGKPVPLSSLEECRILCRRQLSALPERFTRPDSPARYPVLLSPALYELRQRMNRNHETDRSRAPE